MSAHLSASIESQNLCQKLYDRLQTKIPSLKRTQTKRWCGLYEPGRNRFAYISHRKTISRIEVWCLGDIEDLQRNARLNVIPRDEIRRGWEERFPARFFIDQESNIETACDLLYRISYHAS